MLFNQQVRQWRREAHELAKKLAECRPSEIAFVRGWIDGFDLHVPTPSRKPTCLAGYKAGLEAGDKDGRNLVEAHP